MTYNFSFLFVAIVEAPCHSASVQSARNICMIDENGNLWCRWAEYSFDRSLKNWESDWWLKNGVQ